MTWAGRVSLRGPKFLQNMEYKGNKTCGHSFRDMACILPPGHKGTHDYRPVSQIDGGHKCV